jgi:hypothetical protein
MMPNWKACEAPINSDFRDIDGNLFTSCKLCERELLKSNSEYVIERAIQREQVVFEYALCKNCMENAQSRWSEDSLRAINGYMQSAIRFPIYFQESMDYIESENPDEFDLESRLQLCAVKNESRTEMEEYQLMGVFKGDKMIVSVFPYMLSGKAMDEIVDLLSAETLGELDDFTEDLLSWPPELSDINPNRKPILF